MGVPQDRPLLKVPADRPAEARWLTDAERAVLVQHTQAPDASTGRTSIVADLNRLQCGSPVRAAYFALLLALYSYGIWLPQIIQGLARFSYQEIGLLAMLPNLAAAIVLYPWSRHSDTTGERRWHLALPLLLASAGLASAAWAREPAVCIAALTLAAVGIYGSLPVFWSLPAKRLTGASAATAIALVNSIGNVRG